MSVLHESVRLRYMKLTSAAALLSHFSDTGYFRHFIVLMQHRYSYKTPHFRWRSLTCPTNISPENCNAVLGWLPCVSYKHFVFKGSSQGKKKPRFLLVTAFCHCLPCETVHKNSLIIMGWKAVRLNPNLRIHG